MHSLTRWCAAFDEFINKVSWHCDINEDIYQLVGDNKSTVYSDQ